MKYRSASKNIKISHIFYSVSASMPKIFKDAERSTDRIINGFATKGPLPYQLRLDTIFGFKCE